MSTRDRNTRKDVSVKETAKKDALYTGDLESASQHKFMSDLQDVYERHYDSEEIEFRDFRSRKDTCHPVVVTLETPPDSARTQLPVSEKRHFTVTGREKLSQGSSLSPVDRQLSAART